jgi:hypothetical protein
MIKILDKEHMQNQAVENRFTRNVTVYQGTMNDNHQSVSVPNFYNQAIAVTTKVWRNSEKREKLLNRIHELKSKLEVQKNANQGYDGKTIAELVGAYFIDIARLSDEMPDYTGVLTTEVNRPDLPPELNLRRYLPYTGKERVIAGSNDSVPLIEEASAELVNIAIQIKAFGHKNSLWDVVFSPFWDVNRLTETAATIRIDSRNDDVIGKIVRHTFDAAHSIAADATGPTYDVKIYNTIRDAIKKVHSLYHPLYTNRKIGSMSTQLYLLLNDSDVWSVARVISGQLIGASGIAQNVSALPITGIIPYSGGIQNGLPWGKEILNYPGVEEGKFYIIAVNQLGGYTFTKRDLTLEMGAGSVLQLSTEERAWYRIGTTFLDFLIGGMDGSKATGAIIKGALPA